MTLEERARQGLVKARELNPPKAGEKLFPPLMKRDKFGRLWEVDVNWNIIAPGHPNNGLHIHKL
jgi:hypothetical protein